jgi:hypothetical protein
MIKIPVLVTAYRRVDFLVSLLSKLLEFKSDKYILDIKVYSDQAYTPAHIQEVKLLRSNISDFPVKLIERSVNYGLTKNHDDALDDCFSDESVLGVMHFEEDAILSDTCIEVMLNIYEKYITDGNIAGIQNFRLPIYNPPSILHIQRDWAASCMYFRQGYSKYFKSANQAYNKLKELNKLDKVFLHPSINVHNMENDTHNYPDDRFKSTMIAYDMYAISPGYNQSGLQLPDSRAAHNNQLQLRSTYYPFNLKDTSIPYISIEDKFDFDSLQKEFFSCEHQVESYLRQSYNSTGSIPVWLYKNGRDVLILN